jgi:hypothetical protein
MTNHPFDLKGVDTSKVGNNKYVDYKVSDYLKDQNLKATPKSLDAALRQLDLDKNLLKTVPSKSIFGKIDNFLGNFTGRTRPQDYYLPTNITDRLAEADKVKTEKENFNPYSNIEDLLKYELEYKKATDAMDRKGRAADTAMEMLAYRTQLPYISNYMKDLSTFKQRQLLDAEKIKQSLPNAIQDRIGKSALTAATMGNMMANQTDAATRFAQVGMRNPTATFSV